MWSVQIDPKKYYQLDQDVFNTIMLAFREMRFQLPFRWNVQGCAVYSEQQEKYISDQPGLFHFNCNRRQIDTWGLVLDKKPRVDRIPIGSDELAGGAYSG